MPLVRQDLCKIDVFLARCMQSRRLFNLVIASFNNKSKSQWLAPKQLTDAHKPVKDRGKHAVLR